MQEYLLMNKDRPLLSFFAEERIAGSALVEKERFVPEDLLPPGFSDIHMWVTGRNYAKYKEHMKKWLRLWGLDSETGFLNITHGLSLNDTLWVKKRDAGVGWDDVNLYQNDFIDAASAIAFADEEESCQSAALPAAIYGDSKESFAKTGHTITSPEFTAEGSFAKCWVREGDSIYLYKKGSYGFAGAGLEPYSEYYASQVSQRLCRTWVDYDITAYKGSIVSRCKMFTSVRKGFVPAYKLFNLSKYCGYEEILKFCSLFDVEEDFCRMVVLDAVIFNVDRHMGNFGFLVDNDTFQILGFAPVFDHNRSLLAGAVEADFAAFDKYRQGIGHMLGGAFTDVARRLLTPAIRRDLEMLLDFSFTPPEKMREGCPAPPAIYEFSEERLSFLSKAVREQVREILA